MNFKLSGRTSSFDNNKPGRPQAESLNMMLCWEAKELNSRVLFAFYQFLLEFFVILADSV